MPIAAAGIMAGGALLGGAFGSSKTSSSTKRSIQFQREMAQKKYQYLTNDLQAAGLNPILAAQSAAAGPAGATAPVIPYMNPMGEAVQTGVDTYTAAAEVEKTVKETQKVAQEITNLQEILKGISADVIGKETRGTVWKAAGDIVRKIDSAARSQAGDVMRNLGRGAKELSNVKKIGKDISNIIKEKAESLSLREFQLWYMQQYYPERVEEMRILQEKLDQME